jgi:two-component system NtrC family sensor kinase
MEQGSTVRVMEDEADHLRAELEVLNRKLAEAHKMASIGRLSAGIVHEINTPIGSIFSNNEVTVRSLEKVRGLLNEAKEKGSAPPDKALSLIDSVLGLAAVDRIACERISGIVRSLKTFARVTPNDVRKIDVNELIRHTLKLASAVFRRRILFATELGDLPEVECYPGLFGQVLLNLVVNAAQAIEDEGTVTVKSSAEGNNVRVEVIDTGHGIRPEDRAKIFHAGFTTKPIGEGTGIGLSISREIVEDQHGGRIGFESEAGQGSTFYVEIPIEQPRKE